MADAPRFQPGAQFECLNRHGVRYVLIGGVAARLHGSIRKTGDVDICPESDTDNAAKLVAVLTELEARIYVDPETPALPFSADAHSLQSMAIVNTITRCGRLDILWQPAGSNGYGELSLDAVVMTVLGQSVAVVSLDQLIRLKRAAGRPKDVETVADLTFIQEHAPGPAGPTDA